MIEHKCLILGGGGFIGTALVESLAKKNVSLRVLDKSESRSSCEAGLDWRIGDFQNKDDLLKSLVGIDTVIHLVSTSLPKSSNDNPVLDVQSNVIGTLNLLDAMKEVGVKRVIYASSGGTVYGDPNYIPIKESHQTQPKVSYGISKLMVEKYLDLYRHLHGIDYLVLRIANPYGIHQRVETAQGAVANFIQKAINHIPIEIWGDGSVIRDYLHISDVAESFVSALNYKGSERVFNIGTGVGTSLNDLIRIIESDISHPVTTRYFDARSFDVAVNVLDNTLAREELLWSPKISIEQGVKLMLSDLDHQGL